MAESFFFFDLETSGFDARSQRIMQFAGQRTDMDLNLVGDPVNILISMTPDCLPDVDAVFITGITPQQTLLEGITEAEFLREFTQNIAQPGTIFLGYNTIRFDNEFMRFLHYRNFYDPYEWQWQEGRSNWDLLDIVRMTRALRPEGIEWPFDIHGKPTNRLELLSSLNKLEHEHAHDALSDVMATIGVARLIRQKQPKLFDYLLEMRDKKKIAPFVESGEAFVYVSGRYPSEFEKATVAVAVCPHPKRSGCTMVYDLRHDPKDWAGKTPEQLAESMRWKKDSEEPRLPVKRLQYNHCPAIAPLSVLDAASQQRLKLDMPVIKRHKADLEAAPEFADKLCQALELLENKEQVGLLNTPHDVDAALYDGFFANADKHAMSVVRAADPKELGSLGLKFDDQRLDALLPLYKSRNYPKLLTSDERETWDKFCYDRLMSGGRQSKLAKYFVRLQDVASKGGLTGHQEYLLEELRLYAESITPEAEL